MQFTGHIKLPTSGLWSFSLSSDDGSLLYIDGAIFINNDGMLLLFTCLSYLHEYHEDNLEFEPCMEHVICQYLRLQL